MGIDSELTFNDRLLDVSATARSIKSALPSLCLGPLLDSSLGLGTRELFFCPLSLFLERLWNCSHSGSGTVGGGGSHSGCWASGCDGETDGDSDGGGVGGGGVGVVFAGVIAVYLVVVHQDRDRQVSLCHSEAPDFPYKVI